MTDGQHDVEAMVAAYDEEAEATGWRGPEVLFGLANAGLERGQSVLDIGIGTGLTSALFRKAGLTVHGMDISPKMLEACRGKGFTSLELHDLTQPPYPYDSASMDLIVCAGVLNFFRDLSPVFAEAGRIVREGGSFALVVGDRAEGEPDEFEVGPEHTHSDESMTMYNHSPEQIAAWFEGNGFASARNRAFPMFMDRGRTQEMAARAYIASKVPRLDASVQGAG